MIVLAASVLLFLLQTTGAFGNDTVTRDRSELRVIVNDTCFLFHPPTVHYKQCALPSSKPFLEHLDDFDKLFRAPLWMPVKKQSKLGFEWVEPSGFYGQEFADYNHVIKDRGEGKNCLLYYNSSFIEATNCSEAYSSVCVYDSNDCNDNTTENTNIKSSLKLLRSVDNSTRLFLAIEYEKHLKMLGQRPFKCFVDLNISDARLLFNRKALYFGKYKDLSVYVFPALDFVASNYWCESFQKYDLKMIASNRIFVSPCSKFSNKRFVFALDAGNYTKLLSPSAVPKMSTENFCIQSITPQSGSNRIILHVSANNSSRDLLQRRSDASSDSFDIFCFNYNDFLRDDADEWESRRICVRLQSTTEITDELVDILNSTYTSLYSMNKLFELSKNYTRFSELDVYLAALIFRKFSNANVNVSLATSIVQNIMEVNRAVLRESQCRYNATDMLLFRFDKILANAEMVNETECVHTQQGSVMSLVANLKNANLGGVASYNHTSNMSMVVLMKSTPLERLLSDPDLYSAILLPDGLDASEENLKLALTFYLKDSLFNVEETTNIKQVSGIFGTALKGSNGTLNSPIYVAFRNAKAKNQSCAYWKVRKNAMETTNGYWVTTDVEALYNHTDFVICKYYKLAHFALLIFEDIYKNLDEDVIEILETITVINSAFSMFGAFGVILTAVLFKNWRKNKGNLVLMNFVLAICLQNISLHVSNYVNSQDGHEICSLVGAILHYSVLAEFCWMFVIAVLQYKRYVRVFAGPPEHLMTKVCVTGWVLPLVPVVSLLIVQPRNYTKSLVGLCYPAGMALYLSIFVPVGVILIINIIIYILIIVDICSANKKCVKKELIFQWLIVVLLFFMLGVTWVFAFLSNFLKSTILAFIFCVTSTLQGFVVFLFFIVFNQKTRVMYERCFRRLFKRNVVTSKTNTTDK